MRVFLFRIYCFFQMFKNRVVDYCFLLNKQPKCCADLLLIKIDAIGDFVVWQDSLRAYKKKYEGKKVVLLCNQIVYPIAALDPFFSEVWTVDRKRFVSSCLYRFKLISQLQSCCFKEVISPVLSREYVYSDRLVQMAVSPIKIGYGGDVSNMTAVEQRKGNRYYTKLVDKDLSLSSELLINAHFVQQICDMDFVPQLPVLLDMTTDKKRMVGSRKYAVFSISASYYPRAWSSKSFAKVADLILNDYTVVLLGHGKMDRDKGDEFLKEIASLTNVRDLINKTSLLETIEIIRNATFVVGNDSSAVHIASAVRTPSICIAPGAHYNRFVPYPVEISDEFYHPRVVACQMPCFGCNYHCRFPILAQLKCIQDITVAMVVEELNRLLDEIKEGKYERAH